MARRIHVNDEREAHLTPDIETLDRFAERGMKLSLQRLDWNNNYWLVQVVRERRDANYVVASAVWCKRCGKTWGREADWLTIEKHECVS